jgi:hypothetical protein
MFASQMSKVVAAVPAAATTNATTLVIDALAFDSASITVARASNAATAFATVLRLEESDDNVTYVNVPGFVGGTDFVIPTVANTNAVAVVKMDVDTRARRRYLRVQVTPNTSTAIPVAINCRLNRAESAPETAAEAGCVGWVRG